MLEDMGKGGKAKCVERANESKYENLGPFFSQGENGPETLCLQDCRFHFAMGFAAHCK